MKGASIVRWGLRGLVVLVALVSAAFIVLQTPWAHERARMLIESRAATAINGELTIGALSGNFFGRVQFTDVAVTQPGGPVITAAVVEARYQPWQVFTTGAIDSVIVRGLHLNVIEEAGGWNVLGLTESPITGTEGNVEFLVAARRG